MCRPCATFSAFSCAVKDFSLDGTNDAEMIMTYTDPAKIRARPSASIIIIVSVRCCNTIKKVCRKPFSIVFVFERI